MLPRPRPSGEARAAHLRPDRLDDLVTHRLGLDEVNEAFATAVEKPPGFVKATVTMEA
jgi:threonine dehydrogenase-like Zn-dependent dehydrogenase